jgi:ADP-heptose:LPS heptosyltransferase
LNGLYRDKPFQLKIFLGPAEADIIPSELKLSIPYKIFRECSLLEIAKQLSRADFYIGNDSGISHLAGLLNMNGVVMFRDFYRQTWKPFGSSLKLFGFNVVSRDLKRALNESMIDTLDKVM